MIRSNHQTEIRVAISNASYVFLHTQFSSLIYFLKVNAPVAPAVAAVTAHPSTMKYLLQTLWSNLQDATFGLISEYIYTHNRISLDYFTM